MRESQTDECYVIHETKLDAVPSPVRARKSDVSIYDENLSHWLNVLVKDELVAAEVSVAEAGFRFIPLVIPFAVSLTDRSMLVL